MPAIKSKPLADLIKEAFGTSYDDGKGLLGFLAEKADAASPTNEIVTHHQVDTFDFYDGSFDLRKVDPDRKDVFLATMKILGQKLIDQATNDGIKISDLTEFKNCDFNKDGKTDASEVGAILMASCMENKTGIGSGVAGKSTGNGRQFMCSNIFVNDLFKESMAKLLDPIHAETVKMIANKLLQDNGVTVANPQSDQQFIQKMHTQKDVTKLL